MPAAGLRSRYAAFAARLSMVIAWLCVRSHGHDRSASLSKRKYRPRARGVRHLTHPDTTPRDDGDIANVDDIVITRRMIAAGVAELEGGRGAYGDEMLVCEIYKAMQRASPAYN